MSTYRPSPLPVTDRLPPPRLSLTLTERWHIAKLRTPLAVQRWLNVLPYNVESQGATLRSFRSVVRHNMAHCLEAALAAAVVLEQHGYPPLVLSFESVDLLDHVIFVYRRAGRWGSVARSRDPGLHGRKAVFRTPRELALSYFEPYIDLTGRITGYAVADLRTLGGYNWRLSENNIWKVERMLQDLPHRVIASSNARVNRLRKRYQAFSKTHTYKPWKFYPGLERWTELPMEFRNRG